MYEGILTALATPFLGNEIDFAALKKLIDRQVKAGINAIVVGGSTGEGSSVSTEEYYQLISAAIECADGKIKVIAGTTGVNTISTCAKISRLSQMNIDGLMCTVPHYVKPEQEGIYQHFKAINDAAKVPVMIYIHPGRTGSDISDDVLVRLSNLDKIMAVKDASDDIERPLRLLSKVKKGFSFLTGNDAAILAYSANGGVGCVSVISNIYPEIYNKIAKYCSLGDFTSARSLLRKIIYGIYAIGSESNPIGIKCALQEIGACSGEIRLPLTAARHDTKVKIKAMIADLKELNNNV
jgi:4-hydroxy-tetrahydrodipicolinate synthase